MKFLFFFFFDISLISHIPLETLLSECVCVGGGGGGGVALNIQVQAIHASHRLDSKAP